MRPPPREDESCRPPSTASWSPAATWSAPATSRERRACRPALSLLELRDEPLWRLVEVVRDLELAHREPQVGLPTALYRHQFGHWLATAGDDNVLTRFHPGEKL